MTPAALHEQHKARVLGIACSTCSDVGVTGDTCAALGHDPGTTRQHHSEATDALVAKALRESVDVLRMHYADCTVEFGCTVCDVHGFAIDDAQAALKALGK